MELKERPYDELMSSELKIFTDRLSFLLGMHNCFQGINCVIGLHYFTHTHNKASPFSILH